MYSRDNITNLSNIPFGSFITVSGEESVPGLPTDLGSSTAFVIKFPYFRTGNTEGCVVFDIQYGDIFVNRDVNTLGWVQNRRIRSESFTASTSGNGNALNTWNREVYVLSAFTLRGSTIVTPYPKTGDLTSWYFHCVTDSSSPSAVINTSVDIRVLYVYA